MNMLPDGLTDWWQNLVRSSFSWKNLIGQDGDVPQLCQAWVVFDGTAGVGAITPAESYNITSVTKTATGRYTVVVKIPFATANYVVIPSCNDSASSSTITYIDSTITKTTTSSSIVTRVALGIDVDPNVVTVAMFGKR